MINAMAEGEIMMIELHDQFKQWLLSEGLSDENIRNHMFHFLEYSRFCEKHGFGLRDLGIEVTRSYMVWLQERPNRHNGAPLASATRAKHYQTITRIGMFLRERGLYEGPNLTEGIRRPRRKQSVIQGFTVEQLQALLDAVHCVRTSQQYKERLVLLFYMLATTGLRISEALNLKSNDLDHYKRIMVVLGKGNKEREVPFSYDLSVLVRDYIQKYEIPRDGFLFASRYGMPMRTATIRDALRKIKLSLGDKHNIDKIRVSPHTFRHTFARMWVTKDGNSIALSRIMGHTSMHMTSQYVRMWGVDLTKAYDSCAPGNEIKIPYFSSLNVSAT